MTRRRALLNEEREILVINWFQIRIQHDNDNYASSYEIAHGIGMSPSQHVRNILNGMVNKESLERIPVRKSGRYDGWGYRLKRGSFQRISKEPRTLIFNSKRGTQLELF